MAQGIESDKLAEDDEAALGNWEQGDFSTDLRAFLHLEASEDEEFDVSQDDNIVGLVVVSQTCDIVNSGPQKRYVTVCPLIKVTQQTLSLSIAGKTPALAIVETLVANGVVADLTRMMALSKAKLAKLTRSRGFTSDIERARFAYALERKHGRFAFPDEFVGMCGKWLGRIQSKHKSEKSEIGEMYKAIYDLRVRAAPDWVSEKVEIAFIVVVNGANDIQLVKDEINAQVGALKMPAKFVLASPPVLIGTADDFSARDIYESQSIDVRHLSMRGEDVIVEPEPSARPVQSLAVEREARRRSEGGTKKQRRGS